MVKIIRNQHDNNATALYSPIREARMGDLSKWSYLKHREDMRFIDKARRYPRQFKCNMIVLVLKMCCLMS